MALLFIHTVYVCSFNCQQTHTRTHTHTLAQIIKKFFCRCKVGKIAYSLIFNISSVPRFHSSTLPLPRILEINQKGRKYKGGGATTCHNLCIIICLLWFFIPFFCTHFWIVYFPHICSWGIPELKVRCRRLRD